MRGVCVWGFTKTHALFVNNTLYANLIFFIKILKPQTKRADWVMTLQEVFWPVRMYHPQKHKHIYKHTKN